MNELIAFGPVPSRRLGASLGINHIPQKHCPYSCVYCQVGRTTSLGISRREFYPVSQVFEEVEKKIAATTMSGSSIDFLTLVPDGEPTLDIHLGELIFGLKSFDYPVAVISNASLIDRQDVRDELMQADWVSFKVDTVIDADWRRINRPHGRLSLSSILANIIKFREKFHGKLVTETMLVSGINDGEEAIQRLASFLLDLQPFSSYLSIPTRPPAESWVMPPNADQLQIILNCLSERLSFVEWLFEAEPFEFVSTGNIQEDILGIIAVHPMREEALHKMLAQSKEDWGILDKLISSGQVSCIEYRGVKFFLRCYTGNK